MSQIHKKFTDDQVKELFKKYLSKEIERKYIKVIIGIKRKRFFELTKRYKEDSEKLTVKYKKRGSNRKISNKNYTINSMASFIYF